MSQKGPPLGFLIFYNRMYVNKTPKGPPFAFPSLIEHGRNPLGVSKLFSELFISKCWECFKNFALFEP